MSVYRVATFNLENLDEGPGITPPLTERLSILRPQLIRLHADILCLQEVNGQRLKRHDTRALHALDHLLEDTPYQDYHRFASHTPTSTKPLDRHNLVILSRYPIRASTQYWNDLVPSFIYPMVTAKPSPDGIKHIAWDRPLIYAQIELADSKTLHVINLHLRAPLAVPIEGQKTTGGIWQSIGGWGEGYFLAAMKRSGQALETRLLIEQIFANDPNAQIIVCGDFNATEHEVPTRILRGGEGDTNNSALSQLTLVPLERSLPATQRFSVIHHGRKQMLDHFLISHTLLGNYHHMEIHNESLMDELAAYQAMGTPAESYHAPMVVVFCTGSRGTLN